MPKKEKEDFSQAAFRVINNATRSIEKPSKSKSLKANKAKRIKKAGRNT